MVAVRDRFIDHAPPLASPVVCPPREENKEGSCGDHLPETGKSTDLRGDRHWFSESDVVLRGEERDRHRKTAVRSCFDRNNHLGAAVGGNLERLS